MEPITNLMTAPPDSTNGELHSTQEHSITTLHQLDKVEDIYPNTPSSSKIIQFGETYLPEEEGSILTPEHAFVQYQTRSDDQSCQICRQPAVGFHHRAYVCEACKKFFMRHTAARTRNSNGSDITDSVCPSGGQCRIEGPGRGKCPHCRYRKCLDLGMTLTPPGSESGWDISQIPCRVCGGPSSGFHFGALTCEGCKGFFRRTVLSNIRLECLGNNDCPITPANRNMCKSCRYQRCIAVGMSKSGSRIGRQPNAIKYYCAREISQIANNNSTTSPTFNVDMASGQPSSSILAPLAPLPSPLPSNGSRKSSKPRSSTSSLGGLAAATARSPASWSNADEYKFVVNHHDPNASPNGEGLLRIATYGGNDAVSLQHYNNNHQPALLRPDSCSPHLSSVPIVISPGSGHQSPQIRKRKPSDSAYLPPFPTSLGSSVPVYQLTGGNDFESTPPPPPSSPYASSMTNQSTRWPLAPPSNHNRPQSSTSSYLDDQSRQQFVQPPSSSVSPLGYLQQQNRSISSPHNNPNNGNGSHHQLSSDYRFDNFFRSKLPSTSSYNNGNGGDIKANLDDSAPTSTSSPATTWVAAAAAAAAVANVFLAASQVSSTSGLEYDLSSNGDDASKLRSSTSSSSTTTTLFAKRLKLALPLDPTLGSIEWSSSSSNNAVAANNNNATPTNSTGSSNGQTLLPQSLGQQQPLLPSNNAVQHQSLASAAANDPAMMRAAAAAAAVAAATAAELVLSSAAAAVASNIPQPVQPQRSTLPPSSSDDKEVSDAGGEYLPSVVATPTTASSPFLPMTVKLPPVPTTTNTTSTGRIKNGVKPTSITMQEFAYGINIAAKYMLSQRQQIRSNLPKSPGPMETLQCDEVWDRMMKHFEIHSRFMVHFVKLIPGFNQLHLDDRRQLVRTAMYPLILLAFSRDYETSDTLRYNYFDFTESERDVVLSHFPTFKTITGHLIRSGELLHRLKINSIELTLICAMEVFKYSQTLIDPVSTEHLHHLASQVLERQIVNCGHVLEERLEALAHLSPLLEELNVNHHQVLAQLRHDRPHLNFPELFTDMFQLTEPEESTPMLPTDL